MWVICVSYASCLSRFRARLFIGALQSPAGKGLTSWLLIVMLNCVCVTFQCGILGQVWYFIVSIPDLCRVSYFECHHVMKFWLGVCISFTSKFYFSQNDMCFYFLKQSFSYSIFLLLTVKQITALKFFILYTLS